MWPSRALLSLMLLLLLLLRSPICFFFCAKDVTIEINLLWCCCEIRGGAKGRDNDGRKHRFCFISNDVITTSTYIHVRIYVLLRNPRVFCFSQRCEHNERARVVGAKSEMVLYKRCGDQNEVLLLLPRKSEMVFRDGI